MDAEERKYKNSYKWSKKNFNSIKKSVAHWEKDIISIIRNGDKIITGNASIYWEKTKKDVKCHDVSCSLCSTSHFTCSECPYTLFYENNCTDRENGHWRKFFENPNLKTAVAMKRALERMIK